MDHRFADRAAAGRSLAAVLARRIHRKAALVLALPRGGVPVGAEVARALGAEFDVLVVRKLGLPGDPELAIGAVASGGALYLNRSLIARAGVSEADVASVIERERLELAMRERRFRGDRTAPRVEGREVIVVDDGIATGATMRAALLTLRAAHPARLMVAVPVGPPGAVRALADLADEVVCLEQPERFGAVGQSYVNFEQVEDTEVTRVLDQVLHPPNVSPSSPLRSSS